MTEQEDQWKTWIKVIIMWKPIEQMKLQSGQLKYQLWLSGKVCNYQIVYIKVNSTSAHCVDYLQWQIMKDS
jgi:hypothetical protein